MRSSWAAVTVVVALAGMLASCASSQAARGIASGDPQRGAAAIVKYGCGSCHTITGIATARGLVGPPLANLRARMYVAGVLPNTTENLALWIRDPKAINPKTAMPKLGVSAREADDIAAYIESR